MMMVIQYTGKLRAFKVASEVIIDILQGLASRA